MDLLFGELGIGSPELLEIFAQVTEHVFHVLVSVVHPHLVVLGNGHILDLLVCSPFIERELVCHLVTILDGKQVVHHALVCELVDERRNEVHGPIHDKQHSPRTG